MVVVKVVRIFFVIVNFAAGFPFFCIKLKDAKALENKCSVKR